jgi:hypothetical protein
MFAARGNGSVVLSNSINREITHPTRNLQVLGSHSWKGPDIPAVHFLLLLRPCRLVLRYCRKMNHDIFHSDPAIYHVPLYSTRNWYSVLKQTNHSNSYRSCMVEGFFCLRLIFRGVGGNTRMMVWLLDFCAIIIHCRSKWPRGLRHKLSSPAPTLGSWVRILLEAWMSVCVYSVFMLSCMCR